MSNYQNTFHNSKSKKRRYKRNKKKRYRKKNQNQNPLNSNNDQDNNLQQQNDNVQQVNNDLIDINEQKNNAIIKIDGSIMEGGGQILRNCMSLSALLKKPIIISKIRGKRQKTGLRSQHLHGVSLIYQMYDGILNGNYINSNQIKFYPQKHNNQTNFIIDTKTAGSISLLLQTALPCLIYSPNNIKLILKGGTNVSFSPQIDEIKLILLPILKKLFGINISIDIKKRGFYPKGGGEVIVNSKPINGKIQSFQLMNRGKLIKIYGLVILGGMTLNKNIGYDIINGIIQELEFHLYCKQNNVPIKIKISQKPSMSEGVSIIIVAETNTGCLFGASKVKELVKKKRKRNNSDFCEFGRKAAKLLINDFIQYKDSCTDRWVQDQLIIFMALANGISQVRTCSLELHTKTAIYFAQKMTGAKFTVKNEPNSVIIQCKGIGLENILTNNLL